ncbi:MAG: hypothetical protein ABJA34_02060 [Pseudonocardiales bacterium]
MSLHPSHADTVAALPGILTAANLVLAVSGCTRVATYSAPAAAAPRPSRSASPTHRSTLTPNGESGTVDVSDLRTLWSHNHDGYSLPPIHLRTVCDGVNHADSGDGWYFVATCQFAGRLITVDVTRRQVAGERGKVTGPAEIETVTAAHTHRTGSEGSRAPSAVADSTA